MPTQIQIERFLRKYDARKLKYKWIRRALKSGNLSPDQEKDYFSQAEKLREWLVAADLKLDRLEEQEEIEETYRRKLEKRIAWQKAQKANQPKGFLRSVFEFTGTLSALILGSLWIDSWSHKK